MRNDALSDAAATVWAKSVRDPNQSMMLTEWLPLHQHLDDSAGVAGLLWDEWAPRSIKNLLSQVFGGESPARQLLVWLAGTHDVGKASPAFAVQVDQLADRMKDVGLHIDGRIKDSDARRRVRHELVSFLAVRAWLQEQHHFDRVQAESIASVVAAHHGRPPSLLDISGAVDSPELVGDDTWAAVRREFLDRAAAQYFKEDELTAWRTASITQPALVLLSSLVIVADWIASSDLFPLSLPHEQPVEPTLTRVARAWWQLDFPHPWSPNAEHADAASLLVSRFELPAGAELHPTQSAFIEQAERVERPELMILEAEMGSGKTEAALLAAEILAGKFGCSGVFIGLPTQATADGMFTRTLAWAERLRLEAPSNVFLARGRADLNAEYSQKARQAFFRSIGDPRGQSNEMVIAHNWFSNPRRGPLANFVIGTVDQALFAGLRSRYVMLRHLALASKVVIIDEVHAYDEYMREYLVRVLEWLGAYGAPVILLSATLPSDLRRAFLEAYDRGRATPRSATDSAAMTPAERKAARRARTVSSVDRYAPAAGLIGYPSITVSHRDGPPSVHTALPSRASRTLAIGRLDDDPDTFVQLLHGAMRQGGNVAVIRNTVRRAQDTAALLRQAFPAVDVVLAHSRFLGLDRATKDQHLLERYGPRGRRPQQSIVVATQVIEQSLDIDFDLMVSDIAPIDLLLQRTGRLHRHERDRPGPLLAPRLIITGVNEAEEIPQFEKGSEKIYSREILLRTFAVLHDRSELTLPDEIAPLVETVYGTGDSFVPSAWRADLEHAARERALSMQKRKQSAESFTLGTVVEHCNLIGWVSAPDTDPDLTPPGHGTVRDGDATLEVIVLQRDADGSLRTPTWLAGTAGGREIPHNERPDPALTRIILGCFLRLPAGMCIGNALDRHIATLERTFDLPHWHSSHALKGELVLVLDAEGRGTLNEFDLRYSPDDGLEYSRRTP